MAETAQTGKPFDFSIMPSYRCNLRCWFCMYDCSPHNKQVLDFNTTKRFLDTFDWSQINAFGFYGGEPSISTRLYDKFIALVPSNIPKFVITNGAWSLSDDYTDMFINWCAKNQFHVIVSSTPEHIAYQNRAFLENLVKEFGDAIELKKPDTIHAQGRAKGHDGIITDCGKTCLRTDRNIRLGLKPDGNIVFQNCHGEYHIIANYHDHFNTLGTKAVTTRDACLLKR